MRTLGLVLAAAAVLAFSGVAMAGKHGGAGGENKGVKGADKGLKAHAPKALVGTIKSVNVDANGTTITVTSGRAKAGAAAKELTIGTDSKTTVTIDGADAKIGDLKAGQHVKITPPDGKATSIVVRTGDAKGGKHAGGKHGKRGGAAAGAGDAN